MKQEVDSIHRRQHKPGDSRLKQRGTECYYCGETYGPSHTCPAKGKVCSKCENLIPLQKSVKAKQYMPMGRLN